MISENNLYELLKQRIGEREAEAFIQILDQRVNQKFDEKRAELATREDISTLRSELLSAIVTVKGELLKTIYLTSLGQFLAIIASVIALVLVIIR